MKLPSYTVEGLRELVFKDTYKNLPEYLEGFQYTIAVLQDAEALERIAFEFWPRTTRPRASATSRCGSRRSSRCATASTMSDVVNAVDRGLRRAATEFNAQARDRDRRGAAVRGRHDPLRDALLRRPAGRRASAGFFDAMPEADRVRDLLHRQRRGGARRGPASRRGAARGRHRPRGPGERATRPGDHSTPTRWRTRPSSARPSTRARTTARSRSSRPSATCTPTASATAPGSSTRRRSRPSIPQQEGLRGDRWSEFVADKRITIEVCLTSNQQTVPELAADLSQAPLRGDAQAPALHHVLHGQPPGLEHHGVAARSRARSRPSTSPPARSATS